MPYATVKKRPPSESKMVETDEAIHLGGALLAGVSLMIALLLSQASQTTHQKRFVKKGLPFLRSALLVKCRWRYFTLNGLSSFFFTATFFSVTYCGKPFLKGG